MWRVILSSLISIFLESFRTHLTEESRCVACTSFVNGTGLITDDVEVGISYITTQVLHRFLECFMNICLTLKNLSLWPCFPPVIVVKGISRSKRDVRCNRFSLSNAISH